MTRRIMGAFAVAAAVVWATPVPAAAERLPTGGTVVAAHSTARVDGDCVDAFVEPSIDGFAHGGAFGAHDQSVDLTFELVMTPSGCDTLERGRGTLSGIAWGQTSNTPLTPRRPGELSALEVVGTYALDHAALQLNLKAVDLELKMCSTDYAGNETCDIRTGAFNFKLDLLVAPTTDAVTVHGAGTWSGRPG